jgi:hypothetical protein
MAKYEPKTKVNEASVEDFLNSVEDEQKRADAFTILEMFRKATKEEPKMWGAAIVGFGTHKYKYADGHEMDWLMIGFSPRKQNLTLYVINNSAEQNKLLEKLGKHSTGKGCLYLKRLSDVDMKVLKDVIAGAVKRIKGK